MTRFILTAIACVGLVPLALFVLLMLDDMRARAFPRPATCAEAKAQGRLRAWLARVRLTEYRRRHFWFRFGPDVAWGPRVYSAVLLLGPRPELGFERPWGAAPALWHLRVMVRLPEIRRGDFIGRCGSDAAYIKRMDGAADFARTAAWILTGAVPF